MFLQRGSDLKRDRGRLSTLLAVVTSATLGWALAGSAQAQLYGPLADNPVMGGTLNVGSLVEPPGLDPFHQAADARISVTVLMYQGLFYESKTGEALPLLATGHEISDDGLSYTIRLREGVKFHTGAQMSAEDVAYSYNYIRNADNGSPGAGDFGVITSVDVVDPLTVKFVLSEPNAALPMTLGNKYGAVIPKGWFDDENAQNRMNSESVGTGPFKLVEFNPNSNLVLEKNADYWEAGAPYLDAINITFLPNSASMLVAAKNKRIDIVNLSRPQDVVQIEGVEGLAIDRFPSLNQKTIDLGAETKPLDDVRVRQAISLAVDKQQIMQAAIGGYGQVIGTMVIGMQDRWGVPLDELPNQGVDIERAKALMVEAGYADGASIKLTTINGYDWMDPAAVTLKEQLAPIGLDVQIERADLGVWIKNFRASEMGFTFNDWATQPDPNMLFFRHFHKKPEGADFRNWNNDEASVLLEQGRASSSYEERKQIYADFQKLMAETVPTIMMFSADHIVVRSEAVKNFEQHPTGWHFGLARAFLDR